MEELELEPLEALLDDDDIGGHWRLLIANIVKIYMVRCNLLYLKTSGVCITDVRKFLRGQKMIISVYCVSIVRIFMGPLHLFR